MAFEGLTEKISAAFKKLRSHGRLTESDIKTAMREIRMALLESDVNFKVAKDFTAKVSERAIGSDVLESLTPAQQVIKIVKDEMTVLMGGESTPTEYELDEKKRLKNILNLSGANPAVIMMCGLQGAGKTTNAAKLAAFLRDKQGKRPLLVGCDIYRPAAIKQLQVVGEQLNIPVFEQGQISPVKIAENAIAHAREHGNDLVIIDTAGRLHIDEELMKELADIKAKVQPQEILLVIDAMTGQDAVEVASTFDNMLGITGLVITKLDGDTRGGAALSVCAVTGKKIKFAGTGEKLDCIEPFHPDRMASRILGMGDVLTLIEKAQQDFDEKSALEMEQKLNQGKFTLNDFYKQLLQVKKMGPLTDLLGMIPGINAKALEGVSIDDKQFAHVEAIILSMTPEERDNPSIISFSRKKRIAAGSGVKSEEVSRLLKQFDAMLKMTRQMTKQLGSMPKMPKIPGFGLGKFKFPFGGKR